jgi:DNA-directed RNA polymerase specialized sigma24 family protein
VIDELLKNWARWVRVHQRQGRCGSIEHRYKLRRGDDTPYGWGAWLTTPPQVMLPQLDALAALEVEKTMRRLPRKHRQALKYEYVYRLPWKMSCKRLGLGYDRWGEHLSRAQQMVVNLLQRHGKHARIGAQLDVPAHAETRAPQGAIGVCVA